MLYMHACYDLYKSCCITSAQLAASRCLAVVSTVSIASTVLAQDNAILVLTLSNLHHNETAEFPAEIFSFFMIMYFIFTVILGNYK